MTGGASIGAGLGTAPSASGTRTPATAVTAALDACDRLLGEIGRRQHRFSWLFDPRGGASEWLAIDAYYPGSHVVVICCAEADTRTVCEQLVPAHGLHLICLDPGELGGDRVAVSALVRERIEHSGYTPPAPAGAAGASAMAPVGASAVAPAGALAPRLPAASAPAVAGTGTRTEHEQRFGMQIGLVLSVVVLLEVYLAAVILAFGDGQPVLGLGLLLDACARVLGTLAAGRAGEHGDAWARLVLGSPLVAPLRTEAGEDAARLAGAVATWALGAGALGLALLAVGA
jgi:hypothetical protein